MENKEQSIQACVDCKHCYAPSYLRDYPDLWKCGVYLVDCDAARGRIVKNFITCPAFEPKPEPKPGFFQRIFSRAQ